jgi:hypothetical protein
MLLDLLLVPLAMLLVALMAAYNRPSCQCAGQIRLLVATKGPNQEYRTSVPFGTVTEPMCWSSVPLMAADFLNPREEKREDRAHTLDDMV